MNYAYDGTFFGFLSAVFDAYYDGIAGVEAIHLDSEPVLGEDRLVPTDPGKVQRVLTGLQKKCGGKTCHFLYYAFLAEAPGREAWLLSYIRQAFQYQQDFLNHLHEPALWTVREWARKTGNERHKLLGLARFRELSDGSLYSMLAPDCCVVPVMAPHFVKRLAGERWVIHDVKRGLGVCYDRQDLSIVQIPAVASDIPLSAQEQAFSELWQNYYATIAIKERTNHDLRRSFMPKKYWKYLIEMQ